MADGLRRLLSRSRSKSRTRSRPQISEPLEKGNTEGPPLLFRASAYGDTSTGASPVHGLLPLRGNRSYAVRRSSAEYPPSRPSMTAHDSNGSTPRVNRLTKSRSAHASRSTSPDRAPKVEPVELPAPTRRPRSEVITGRPNGSRQRSQRSSRNSSPGRDAPPVPPLPSNAPSEAGSTQYRASSASDRPKRASRQNSWERDGPNSLAAHPPFAQIVASRYNPRRNSQSSTEEPRISVPVQVQQEARGPSKAGYPHGSPTTAHMDRDGQPKPLEPAWYITRTSKSRSPKEYEKARLAVGAEQHIPARPISKTTATPPPVELEAPPPELEAPPPRPERRRPRTQRSHIQRKNSTGGSRSREGRLSSSQERTRSAGAETRAAVAAAMAAAAAAAPAERNVSTERGRGRGGISELEANPNDRQANHPPDSPRDDVSAISWATAEDGQRAPSQTRGLARPADVLFSAESDSRQDTPKASGVQGDRQLDEDSTPVRQGRKDRDIDYAPPADNAAAEDDDYYHVPGAFPTPEEVVRRAQFNSVNTTVYETVAPAVTHEIIVPRIHHVREEQITREIHNHDVYHRVLPIKETVILPPKHFRIGKNGELVELRPEEIPHNSDAGWVFLETVSKEEIPLEPKKVTAQELLAFSKGKHGQGLQATPADEKTWFTSDGTNPT